MGEQQVQPDEVGRVMSRHPKLGSATVDARRRVYRRGPLSKERQAVINRMTNWQRTQWSRAGFPVEMDRLEHFAMLMRPIKMTPLTAAILWAMVSARPR